MALLMVHFKHIYVSFNGSFNVSFDGSFDRAPSIDIKWLMALRSAGN